MKNKSKKTVENINNSNEKLLLSDVSFSEVRAELCSCGLNWFHAQYELDDNKCENCGKRIRA